MTAPVPERHFVGHKGPPARPSHSFTAASPCSQTQRTEAARLVAQRKAGSLPVVEEPECGGRRCGAAVRQLAQKQSGGTPHHYPAADADLPVWRLEERTAPMRCVGAGGGAGADHAGGRRRHPDHVRGGPQRVVSPRPGCAGDNVDLCRG